MKIKKTVFMTSIRFKIFALTIPLLTVLAMAISALNLVQMKNMRISAMRELLRSTSSNLRAVIYKNLDYFPLDGFGDMNAYLRNFIATYRDIDYCHIFAPDGRVLYSSDKAVVGTTRGDPAYRKLVFRNNSDDYLLTMGRHYELVMPIMRNSEAIGTIHMGLKLDAVSNMLRNVLIKNLLILAVTLIISLFLLYTLITITISKPISLLARQVSEVAAYFHLRQHTPDARGDELQRFKASLTALTTELREMIVSQKKLHTDIETLTQEEIALRESRQKLSGIINFLPDATFVINMAGEVVAWNKAMEELSGVPAQDMLGKGSHEYALPFYGKRRPMLIDLIHLPNPDIEKTYRHLTKDGDMYVAELSLPGLRGKDVVIWAKAAPLYDESGKAAGSVETMRDITERVATEKVLLESEARYRLLADNATDLIWTIGLDMRFTYFSPSARRILGYTPEEMLSMRLADFMPDHSVRIAQAVILEELARESIPGHDLSRIRLFELQHICKNGEIIWVEIKACFLRNEQKIPYAVLGITRNITERKEADRKLRESEEKLRAVFDNAAGAILIAHPGTGKILDCNPHAEILLGRSRAEIIGMHQSELHPPGKTDDYRERFRLHASEGHTQDYEGEILHKDGRTIPVMINAQTFKLGDQTLLLGLFIDISESKKAEVELQNAYTELQKTQQQLIQAEKMEAIGRMASGIAHEVKNPLGIVLQGVNYLDDRFGKTGEKTVTEVLRAVKDNIKRADTIIRALVDFSRVRGLELRTEDLNAIIENSLVLVQHEIKSGTIEVVKEFQHNLPRILADKGKLEQVFINLLRNSIQAMPTGGKLFLRTSLAALSEPGGSIGRRTGDFFRIGEHAVIAEVEDTGTGIPADQVTKVFEPFFTTKEPGQGTGLGLTVSANIIQMHQGSIQITSEEGRGTKITVALKVSPA